MPKFRIPKAYQKGFTLLFELDEQTRKQLLEEIKNAPYTLSLEDLTAKLADSFNLAQNKVDEIIRTIISLAMLRETTRQDVNTFVSEILHAMRITEDQALKPPDNFQNQLQELLNLDESPFYTKAKAKRLVTERDKILLNTRIITDIRPIFTEDIDCIIKGNLILHNLMIDYVESGEVKEIYFALDKDDLKKLKDYIERAEKKEKVLREKLKEARLEIVDYK